MYDKREKAEETKYAMDQEREFKLMARRNKLFGLWAAEQLGKDGADAEAYAKDVVMADFEQPGDDDVLHKVLRDLDDAGIEATETDLRREMNRLLSQVKEQMDSENR